MFGYVRVNASELKVREHEFYRGTYCGLCRAMGKCTGQCSRMTLSYDFVFLALVRMALTKEPASFSQKRCLAHPLHKRNSMNQNQVLDYCAAAAALLTYHKLSDDLADEKGGKRLKARLLRPFAAHARKKAMKQQGLAALDSAMADALAELTRQEQEKEASVDVPARIFGKLLGQIVSFGLDGNAEKIASQAGYAIGRWIYIADALDDAREDLERERYNPFLLLYDGRVPDSEERKKIGDALKNELFVAEAAFDLIDFDCRQEDIRQILLNILYLGMPARIDNINEKEQKENQNTENGQSQHKKKSKRSDKNKEKATEENN